MYYMQRFLSVQPGERFGKWTVIGEVAGPQRPVECVCDCGTTRSVLIGNLVNGRSRSCGLGVHKRKVRPERLSHPTHGLSRHPLYHRWSAMMDRCYNPAHIAYKNYGGRGITVCPEWHDVCAYVAWVEANLGLPAEGMTMDRIDNDGNYEPGNLRWATAKLQVLNQRKDGRPKGSAIRTARLTEDIVREARARFANGEVQRVLAAEYGVSFPTMHKAVVGKTWQHA